MKLSRLAVQNIFNGQSTGEVQIIKFVNNLLEFALEQKASDIHIEPLERVTRIRLRIDGFLYTALEVASSYHNAIVSRIKIISSLDIAEKRLPQDGRVDVDVSGRKVDLRIATLPVMYGERVVIRVLEKNQVLLDLASLDFSEANLEAYEKIISAPNGMVLLTGPTGSGKSTTLYATLAQLNDEAKNIITIEDPVERTIEGVQQIAVNNKAGLTFATGLRSILRQDPNIIMVGEIRDQETARIAVQSALTGHLVLSTLHTNNAVGAVTRLLDIGIEPFLVAAALRGVVAQRLVRRICPNCREVYPVSQAELAILGCEPSSGVKLYRGRGCEKCNHTGYKGRMAIQEVLPVTSELQNLFIKGAEEEILLTQASANGFATLRQDCIAKVLAGQTTVEELLRVAYC